MTDEFDRVALGSRVTVGQEHSVRRIRDISEPAAAELGAKFRRVREMAEPDGHARVNASGVRLQALFATAEDELQNDGVLSALTQKTARLELQAFASFADDLAERLIATERDDPEVNAVAKRLEKRLENIAAVRQGLRSAIESEGTLLEVHGGALRIFPIGNYTAEEVIASMVGEFALAAADSLLLREPEFRALSEEIKELAGEIEEGMPSIIRTVEHADAPPSNLRITDFPMIELGALDASLEMIRDGDAGEGMLNLMRARSRRRVLFGAAAADFAVIGGTSKEGLDMLPEASIRIHIDLLGSEPIDYWATVTDTIEQMGESREMFRGAVQGAEVSERIVDLECEGATALTEHTTGGMVAAGISQVELIAALMEQAGVESEFVLSEVPDEPTVELFEVWVPLDGLTVTEPVDVGGISVVSPGDGMKRLRGLNIDLAGETGASLAAEFEKATSYALTTLNTAMPNRAEDAGLAKIDLALSWIATRGRYGAALLPDGEPQSFDRQAGRLTARRGPVVLVFGTETGRQWLRWPEGTLDAAERHLDPGSSFLRPQLPDEIDVDDRLALRALRLAATERDPLIQIQALWQAIESYAAGTKSADKIFTKPQLRRLKEAIPEEFDQIQRGAVERMIGRLNQEPLRLRLKRRLKSDAVPITERELEVLDDLREARNDVTHGRDVKTPLDRNAIDYGISIVARILVHRIAAAADS